jgi:hypothetical protein
MICVVFLAVPGFAAKPNALWTKYLGTPSGDYGYSAKQTPDGGFIVTGVTYSSGAGDVYLLKVDADGDSLWDRAYGGPLEDIGFSVDVCSDGGFIITGLTYSYAVGQHDLYLIRTDANGDTLWTKTYGTADYDQGRSVVETDDGGFIIAGCSDTWWIRHEAWVIKTDANGDSVWSRHYRTHNNTCGYEVRENTVGGQHYAVGGTAAWTYGAAEVYLVRIEENGDTLWTKSYGSAITEYGYGLDWTSDLGFVLVGVTYDFGGSAPDFYVVKTDVGGDSLWQRTYGGSDGEIAHSVRETPDGGYIVVGETDSYGHGRDDAWLVKLSASGDTMWTRAYGDWHDDAARQIQITSDGGCIVAGYGYNPVGGSQDVFLIRMGTEASVEPHKPPLDLRFEGISPNPSASSVRVSYVLTSQATVSVRIYDVTGRLVATLLDGASKEAGHQSLTWDGRDSDGARQPPGIYFCRLSAGDVDLFGKVVLVR